MPSLVVGGARRCAAVNPSVSTSLTSPVERRRATRPSPTSPSFAGHVNVRPSPRPRSTTFTPSSFVDAVGVGQLPLVVDADVFVSRFDAHRTAARALDDGLGIGADERRGRRRCAAALERDHDGDSTPPRPRAPSRACGLLPAHRVADERAGSASGSPAARPISRPPASARRRSRRCTRFCSSEKATSSAALCSAR